MPAPENRAALQRFLGMTNYLNKFIQNYSEKTAVLRELLRNDIVWSWTDAHQQAFNRLKDDLMNPPVLKFFNPAKPVVLSVDSSKSGLGAACLQEDAPVAYASRALSDCETRYAQIEKELLAAVFACRKFHDFVSGRKVTIETDHKPLITIVKKSLNAAPARLQRMLLQLQRYNLDFVYKKGKELYLADTLSRAFPNDPAEEEEFDCDVMTVLSISPVRMTELQKETLADPTMQKLAKLNKDGWPDHERGLPSDVKCFFPFRDELVIENDVIMKGQRAVVPKALRSTYIAVLHNGHMGTERTRLLASDIVFWPKMRQDIEDAVSQCSACNSYNAHLQKQPLMNHPVPELPWSSLAADIFDWNGKQYLVVVDSYSGWFEMDMINKMTSNMVILKMKRHFASHGIPEKLMTDNGTQFTSREFKQFAQEWNFVHITSSPHYPRSNGLAENAVKQAKQLLEKSEKDGSDVYLGLLNLRNTPRDDMCSPSQRLNSRRMRATLPTSTKLLQPKAVSTRKVSNQLKKSRQQQKQYHDRSARDLRPLKQGEVVRMQTEKGFKKLAIVKSARHSPRSYVITADGADYVHNRRHLLPVQEPRPQVPQALSTLPRDNLGGPGSVRPPFPAPSEQQPASSPPPAAVVTLPLSAPTPLTPQLANVPRSRFTPVQLFPSPAPPTPTCSMPRQAGATNKTLGPIAPTTPGPVPATTPGTPSPPGPAPTALQPQPVVTRAGRAVKRNPKYFD